MKRVLALILTFTLVMTGCSAGGDSKEASGGNGVKIGYSSNDLNDTFLSYVLDAAVAKGEEYGYDIDVQDAQNDVIKQQDQINTMIEQDVDALIVLPVDTSATDPITNAAVEAEIPLVYVNKFPFEGKDIPDGVYYVGSDDFVPGQLQGEYLLELLGEEANIGILMGILINEGAIKRTEGLESVIADYPGIKVLAKEPGDWQKDMGMNITENWLTAYGDELDAILSNNDEMAIGALNALKAENREDRYNCNGSRC